MTQALGFPRRPGVNHVVAGGGPLAIEFPGRADPARPRRGSGAADPKILRAVRRDLAAASFVSGARETRETPTGRAGRGEGLESELRANGRTTGGF